MEAGPRRATRRRYNGGAADITAAPGDDATRAVLDATDGRGADLAIECASRVSVLAQAMNLARIGGRVLAYSTYTEKQGELPFYDWYFKELQIINARAAKSEDYPACIDLVRRGQVRLDRSTRRWRCSPAATADAT
jgi:threonine dehydrogenase-like Zn-dependent dehydrogenase